MISNFVFIRIKFFKATVKNASDAVVPSEMGMHYFMRVISDEIQASKPIVRIPSLLDNGDTVEVTPQKRPTIFIVPGVEGNEIFLCKCARVPNYYLFFICRICF